MEITKDNFQSEYKIFMEMYTEAQEKFINTKIVDNDTYIKCLEYSFRLTEYFNPIHPLKYIDHLELIKNLYYIRAELLVRTVGVDTTKPKLSDEDKQVFYTVVALLRKSLSVDPLYLQAMELFKVTFIYLTIYNANIEENITYLKQVLYIYPQDFQLQLNLGFAYQRKNDLENSIAHYKLALGIINLHHEQNDVLLKFKVKCYNGLGSVYYTVQDRELAKYYFLKALEEMPDDPDINNQLGVIYTELRITDKAIHHYKHGINNFSNSHISNDADMLIASLYMNMGLALCYQCDFESAIESYNKALKYKPRLSLAYQNKLLDLNYISHLIEDPMYIANLHKNITNIYETVITDYKVSLPGYKVKVDSEKLNIGFVSGDFICHPVSYFITGILKNLDTTKFNVTCYTGKIINVQGEYPNCKWVTTKGKSNVELAEIIKLDKIDILFDLSGHTGDNRLDTFVLKPAPIQISYCGYPGSSGIKSMDYRLTDRVADCKKSERYYREKLVYLPDTFLNYTPAIDTKMAFLTSESESPYKKNGYITFGCFNRFNKINDLVIKCWERILQGAENARLVIKTKEFLTKEIKEKFLGSFGDQSVLERIQILDYSDTYVDHLPDYNLMDVSLDTFPYSGTTTSCESLYMGVPVLTIYDNVKYLHSQNVTSSLLTSCGLSDYITHSEGEYVCKAIELATSFKDTKEDVRRKFLESPISDTRGFVSNFQDTLRKVYNEHKW